MVLKTNVCRFSGLRIYPGKGLLFIRVDGQQYLFLNKKCKNLYHNRLKPAKLAWTTTYRKQHKKDQVREGGGKGHGVRWTGARASNTQRQREQEEAGGGALWAAERSPGLSSCSAESGSATTTKLSAATPTLVFWWLAGAMERAAAI